jgi:hypothetical protein
MLRPYGTVTAEGSQGAIAAAFLARHYGGHENDGSIALLAASIRSRRRIITR